MFDSVFADQEAFLGDCEVVVAVVGRAGESILVELPAGMSDAQAELARSRGYGYCGCLGVSNGKLGARCEQDADSIYTCLQAVIPFAHIIRGRLKPLQETMRDDFVAFMESIFKLRDPRE